MDEVSRIAYEDFANNLATILHRVVNEKAIILVETLEGDLAVLRALTPAEQAETYEPDIVAFRSAAGSWADVDADELLERVRESRNQPGRPAVYL